MCFESKLRTIQQHNDNAAFHDVEVHSHHANIAAVSNIPTQVFEHMFGGIQFCSIPQSLQRLQVRQCALIPSIAFLCLLWVAQQNSGIRLLSAVLFRKLNSWVVDIAAAAKAFGSRKKGKGPQDG
ncbi:hypothetical protein DFH07DRAFT_772966 [Mycena maculata]|uniref:Uncharacterized protein n=1 Tax=Mycena maculata TaxID=230809 RepID=A0AAD7J5C2_9AGAR|nr:hypothetical protein DFH07DRAFT_772966 [Mycena maculata]